MYYVLPDGQKIYSPQDIEVNGDSIKAAVFADPELCLKKGVTIVVEENPVLPFYKATGQTVVAASMATPSAVTTYRNVLAPAMTLEELKATRIAEVKRVAYSILQPTDWQVIRSSETANVIDQKILDGRAAVRKWSNDLEKTFDAMTYDQLATLKISYPEAAK